MWTHVAQDALRSIVLTALTNMYITVEMTPTAIADKFEDKFVLKRGEGEGLHLSPKHHHYAQVQGELAAIDSCREWCDFIVCTAMAKLLTKYWLIWTTGTYWNKK